MPSNDPSIDPTEDLRRLNQRVERLERTTRHDDTYRGFGPAYAAAAAAMIILTFLPLYGDSVDKEYDITWRYGSIWEIAGNDNSGVSMIGILLFVALITVLAIASFVRVTEAIGLPISAIGISLVLVVLILTKPSTPDPDPALEYGGQASVAILLITALIAAVHVGLLARLRRDSR